MGKSADASESSDFSRGSNIVAALGFRDIHVILFYYQRSIHSYLIYSPVGSLLLLLPWPETLM